MTKTHIAISATRKLWQENENEVKFTDLFQIRTTQLSFYTRTQSGKCFYSAFSRRNFSGIFNRKILILFKRQDKFNYQPVQIQKTLKNSNNLTK